MPAAQLSEKFTDIINMGMRQIQTFRRHSLPPFAEQVASILHHTGPGHETFCQLTTYARDAYVALAGDLAHRWPDRLPVSAAGRTSIVHIDRVPSFHRACFPTTENLQSAVHLALDADATSSSANLTIQVCEEFSDHRLSIIATATDGIQVSVKLYQRFFEKDRVRTYQVTGTYRQAEPDAPLLLDGALQYIGTCRLIDEQPNAVEITTAEAPRIWARVQEYVSTLFPDNTLERSITSALDHIRRNPPIPKPARTVSSQEEQIWNRFIAQRPAIEARLPDLDRDGIRGHKALREIDASNVQSRLRTLLRLTEKHSAYNLASLIEDLLKT